MSTSAPSASRSEVLLHIGLFKTGTQSIQRFLREREHDLLAPRGMRYPRGWLRLNCHLEPHMALMRQDRTTSARVKGTEWHDPAWCADVLDQIRADLERFPDQRTILSGEHNGLMRFDDELAPLRDLLGDAEIVVYLREPAAFLASMRDQLEKYEIGTSDDPAAFNYVEPDSWLVDYDARLAKWREHFSVVTVFDYDECLARDGSVVPSFARHLGIDDDLGDLSRYWINKRGERGEGLEPGNRWTTGGRFGDPA